MIGRVPRYSNAFWIPAAFCCTADDTVLAAVSAHPRTVPKPELSSLRPELTPLNALFHPDFTVLAVLLIKLHELLVAPELSLLETTQNCFAPQLESCDSLIVPYHFCILL